ncbi:MAG TPA: PilZ domain-containing protein [Humisphaera sp.]
MNLSADQFSAVMKSLENPAPREETEKRRAPRVAHRARVPIVIEHGTPAERTTVVTVRDLSPRGIGLLHSDRLARGTPFMIRIDRKGGPAVCVLCTVAHCRLQPGGVYSVGAEFTCVLNKEQQPPAESVREDLERIRRSVLA